MKVIKCLNVCIIVFAILLTFPIISSAYANQYPAYLDNSNCAYIECRSNLGVGTVVLPMNYQNNYIAFDGSNKFFNTYGSTINGYFISANGTKTTLRGQALSDLQYPVTVGYTTTYYDFTYSEILNTNIKFSEAEQSINNDIYIFSTYEKVVLILLVLLVICEFLGFATRIFIR